MLDKNTTCCANCDNADLVNVSHCGGPEIVFVLVDCFAREKLGDPYPPEMQFGLEVPHNCKHFKKDSDMGVTIKQKERPSIIKLAKEISDLPPTGVTMAERALIIEYTIKLLAQMPLDDVLRLFVDVSPDSMKKWLVGDPDGPEQL